MWFYVINLAGERQISLEKGSDCPYVFPVVIKNVGLSNQTIH